MPKENQDHPNGVQFTKSGIAFRKIGDFPDAPTLIFLHDSFGCIHLWRDFPEQLGTLTQCNVLIYDRQGYGRSCPFSSPYRAKSYMEREADTLKELMDYWEIPKALLFGHSDGGSIALLMAAKYPDRVQGIITEGAHVFVEDITLHGIQHAIKLYETSNLKDRLAKYHGDKTEAMFWAWAATWTRDGFTDWNIEAYLPRIFCPVFVIQGMEDEYGSLEQVDSILDQVQGPAVSFLVQGIGHTPHKEVPDRVLERTSLFINEIL